MVLTCQPTEEQLRIADTVKIVKYNLSTAEIQKKVKIVKDASLSNLSDDQIMFILTDNGFDVDKTCNAILDGSQGDFKQVGKKKNKESKGPEFKNKNFKSERQVKANNSGFTVRERGKRLSPLQKSTQKGTSERPKGALKKSGASYLPTAPVNETCSKSVRQDSTSQPSYRSLIQRNSSQRSSSGHLQPLSTPNCNLETTAQTAPIVAGTPAQTWANFSRAHKSVETQANCQISEEQLVQSITDQLSISEEGNQVECSKANDESPPSSHLVGTSEQEFQSPVPLGKEALNMEQSNSLSRDENNYDSPCREITKTIDNKTATLVGDDESVTSSASSLFDRPLGVAKDRKSQDDERPYFAQPVIMPTSHSTGLGTLNLQFGLDTNWKNATKEETLFATGSEISYSSAAPLTPAPSALARDPLPTRHHPIPSYQTSNGALQDRCLPPHLLVPPPFSSTPPNVYQQFGAYLPIQGTHIPAYVSSDHITSSQEQQQSQQPAQPMTTIQQRRLKSHLSSQPPELSHIHSPLAPTQNTQNPCFNHPQHPSCGNYDVGYYYPSFSPPYPVPAMYVDDRSPYYECPFPSRDNGDVSCSDVPALHSLYMRPLSSLSSLATPAPSEPTSLGQKQEPSSQHPHRNGRHAPQRQFRPQLPSAYQQPPHFQSFYPTTSAFSYASVHPQYHAPRIGVQYSKQQHYYDPISMHSAYSFASQHLVQGLMHSTAGDDELGCCSQQCQPRQISRSTMSGGLAHGTPLENTGPSNRNATNSNLSLVEMSSSTRQLNDHTTSRTLTSTSENTSDFNVAILDNNKDPRSFIGKNEQVEGHDLTKEVPAYSERAPAEYICHDSDVKLKNNSNVDCEIDNCNDINNNGLETCNGNYRNRFQPHLKSGVRYIPSHHSSGFNRLGHSYGHTYTGYSERDSSLQQNWHKSNA